MFSREARSFMKSIGTTIAGLIACTLGAYLMASALFGHNWLVGEHQGLEVRASAPGLKRWRL